MTYLLRLGLILVCALVFATSASSGWSYKQNSRFQVTPTTTVFPPAEGSISGNINGSTPLANGLPSILKLNAQGLAQATDNEALFAETGMTTNVSLVADEWVWTPNDGEPAHGEIEDRMIMSSGGWLHLVNGEAAGSLLLVMEYENNIGTSKTGITSLARSTESRSAFAFEVTVPVSIGFAPAAPVTVTIPINISYNVGETRYPLIPIQDVITTAACRTHFTRKMRITSQIEVFADGWILDMAIAKAEFNATIQAITDGRACPQ